MENDESGMERNGIAVNGGSGRHSGGGVVSMELDGGGGVSVKKEEEGMVFTSTTEFTSRLEVGGRMFRFFVFVFFVFLLYCVPIDRYFVWS